jgi:hypothetical protein
MSKKTLKMADGGSLSDKLALTIMPTGGTGGAGGGGGGTAFDGLGQVGEGSRTISSALSRAQKSNMDATSAAMSANEAIGGYGMTMPKIGSTIGNPTIGSTTPIATQTPTQPREIPESIVSPMKKGGEVKKSQAGKINLGNCRVNTVTKNKASPNW